ncbi:recombinase [Planktothrix sp. FACHB-1365]|uniref:recombinase n=1 Tax=Planktothrix sp. FACHB-1365 TaxID=2692855 RepID=UPI0016838C7C|nr:recombinase [Planktothrix sp. FACHB-1365]MBD2482300.1 recombinase [Planktothrix sp. FACHB-1365]
MSNSAYSNYGDLLAFYNRKRKECPRGVSLKLQDRKHLLLQFTFPDTGKRSSKTCGVQFTEEGVIQAVSKSHRVSNALQSCKTSSEFWTWYDKEILNKNEIKNDLITYRDIFEKLENKFWNDRNKNTKRKRSKDIPNDVATYNRYYGIVFNKFTNWDKYPEWEELKNILFSWNQGTKMFKDAYHVISTIIKSIPNNQLLLEKLNNIDPTQLEFKEKQSISLDEFLSWYDDCIGSIETLERQCDKDVKKSWLWVCAMCVLYGLRPSEIAAIKNLTESIIVDGVTIPALNDINNKDLLIYLGEKTYFDTTTKTGTRICSPMIADKELINKLRIQHPKLPSYKPDNNAKLDNISNGFSRVFRKKLISYNCPVTQAYAFRHLSNQLGEKYGIPQEIRARMLGHSVAVNESAYKQRNNTRTTIDLLTNHSRLPLSLDTAKQQLESSGFNLSDPSVKAMLRIIYQLDN